MKRKLFFPVLILLLILIIASSKTTLDDSRKTSLIQNTLDTSETKTETETASESEVEVATSSGAESKENTTEKDTLTEKEETDLKDQSLKSVPITSLDIPAWSGKDCIEMNNNIPYFKTSVDYSKQDIYYSPLDALGRCSVCYAYLSTETLAKEERGEIGQFTPSGWHTVKYPDIIEDRYLYNRCHLLGFQFLGKDSNNENNLITGTRAFNAGSSGMLPLENKVKDYIENTKNRVLYRVTPIFSENNLVADGVLMEALSQDEKLCFNVFVYNVQPGIEIDYATGESRVSMPGDAHYQENLSKNGQSSNKESDSKDEKNTSGDNINTDLENTDLENTDLENTDLGNTDALNVTTGLVTNDTTKVYICNENTKKFHKPTCKSVKDMKEKNKRQTNETRDELIEKGYSPCKNCKP